MNHSYQRIAIVGSGGSGKSTLARRLAAKTSLPVVHLDMQFWRPNWEMTPKDEWIDKQMEMIKPPQWIIDGDYGSTMGLRFTAADLVIFLDIPRIICIYRVLKRRNKERSDFPDFLEEKFDLTFLKWIWNYPKKNRSIIMKLHEEYPEKPFIIIRNKRELRQILEEFGDT